MNRAIEFLLEHKTKFFWTFGLSVSAYGLSEYLKSKLISMQSELFTAHAAQANIVRRFEQNQQDSIFTVLSFLPEISTSILSEFNAEQITYLLQKKQSENVNLNSTDNLNNDNKQFNGVDKKRLWEELKIISFTRVFVASYTLTLLTLLTRLQLNIIGRYMYLNSILYDNPHPASLFPNVDSEAIKYQCSIPSEIEQMYLTFSWYFLHEGWKLFAEKVKEAVLQVFGGLSLKSPITPELLSQLINQVRAQVESEMDGNLRPTTFASILLPLEEKEYEILNKGGISIQETGNIQDPLLRKLLDETRDIIESPQFYRTFLDCSTSIFNLVLHQLNTCFLKQEPTKLASLLSIAKNLTPSILTGTPNDFNLALAENTSLRNLCMLIYNQYSNVCGY